MPRSYQQLTYDEQCQTALGDSHEEKLGLWQVIARVLEQGSRLSAVRLGKTTDFVCV